MTQLRINWLLSDGVTKRRQTLPLVSSASDSDIQNIVSQLENLTTRSVDAAFKVTIMQVV